MDPVVVFGASSYVGSSVVRRLLADGHRVVGVSRSPATAQILLPEQSQAFSITTPQDVDRLIEGEAVSIVNLAYVKGSRPELLYRDNKLLATQIERAAPDRCQRLIHISTCAVFGDTFPESGRPTRVRWRAMSDPYAESKIHQEHLMEAVGRRLGCALAIVRLGNVIGPGSPLWVAGLAQQIMERKAVGYEGEEGFSNTTHVDNVADYIAFLVGQPTTSLREFGPYHHLAEFSSRHWSELLDVIGGEIGCSPISVPRVESAPSGARSLRTVLKSAYGSSAGAYARAGFGLLPESGALDRLLALIREPTRPHLTPDAQPSPEDAGLLEILASKGEFRTCALGDWEPTLDFDTACAGIAESVRTSGFRLEAPGAH